MAAPAKLPRPIVTRLHGEILKFINEPDTQKRITADGSRAVGSTPEAFLKFLHADVAKWAKIVKESGARID